MPKGPETRITTKESNNPTFEVLVNRKKIKIGVKSLLYTGDVKYQIANYFPPTATKEGRYKAVGIDDPKKIFWVTPTTFQQKIDKGYVTLIISEAEDIKKFAAQEALEKELGVIFKGRKILNKENFINYTVDKVPGKESGKYVLTPEGQGETVEITEEELANKLSRKEMVIILTQEEAEEFERKNDYRGTKEKNKKTTEIKEQTAEEIEKRIALLTQEIPNQKLEELAEWEEYYRRQLNSKTKEFVERAKKQLEVVKELKKLQEDLKNKKSTTKPAALEKEYAQIQNSASNKRFGRRLLAGVTSLGTGIAFLEISGHSMDMHKGETAPGTQKPAVGHESEKPETHTPSADAIVHKGEGIENAFIRQIEHNDTLAKSLGWDGKENLHHFAGREAHLLATKEGYVDNSGHEIRVSEADKVAYEIKQENGKIIVDEKTITGDTVETHHEGDKFEEQKEKYEYKYDRTAHVSGHEVQAVKPEMPGGGQEHEVQAVKPEMETEAAKAPGYSFITDNDKYMQDYSQTIIPGEHTPDHPGEIPPTDNHQVQPEKPDLNNNTHTGPSGEEKINALNMPEVNHYHLSVDEMKKVDNVFNNNIDKLFPKTLDGSSTVKGLPADFFQNLKTEDAKPAWHDTVDKIHSQFENIQKVTGLKPGSVGVGLVQRPETSLEYIHRALERAAASGDLNKLKL